MNFLWSMSYFKTAFWCQIKRMVNKQAKLREQIHAWFTKGMYYK